MKSISTLCVLVLLLGLMGAEDEGPNIGNEIVAGNHYLVVAQYGLRVEAGADGRQRLVMSEGIADYLENFLPIEVFDRIEGTFCLQERSVPQQGKLVFMTDDPRLVIGSLFADVNDTRKIFKMDIMLVTKEAYDMQKATDDAD